MKTLELAIGDVERLTKDQTEQFETIHKQTTEIQLHAERKCRKIIKPDLDFSEEVNFWHERVNAWRALLKQKQGRVKHLGPCFRICQSFLYLFLDQVYGVWDLC